MTFDETKLNSNCSKALESYKMFNQFNNRKYVPSLHGSKVQVMVQRASNHYPNPPLVTVVGMKKGQHPSVVSFQPITGKFTDHSG